MAGETILSLDAFLAADGIEYVVVDTPQLGGSTRLGSISAAASVDFAEANADPVRRADATLRLIAVSVVDAQGARVPLDQIDAWIAALKQKGSGVVSTLLSAAMTLNGMTLTPAAQKNDSGGPAHAAPPTD
jgi:hypothetical protein